MVRAKTSETMPLRAQWYEGVAGLRQLRADWYELTPNAQLFARYEWNLAAATHLVGDNHSIWFCRIGDDAGRPVAIIPAVTANALVKPFGLLPTLTLGWNDQLAAFDFPLAHGAKVFEVGKTMLKAFSQLHYHWRVISWPRVMANSNAAKVAMALNRSLTDIIPSSVCSTFYTGNVPNPAEGFEIFTVKSHKLRRTLSQHSRRLCQHGPVQMRMAREEGDVESFFNEFLRIESSGWKGEKGTRTAIALVPAARAFYSSLLAESNAAFETDIALLYCGDKAVAGQFLIRTGRWEYVS
ncbi:MAG: GNAT family N-acetyltransferase, partial [Formivibrio sp.]|nr:GNAT family N-acetyltransferase [Formivibrio sp.]